MVVTRYWGRPVTDLTRDDFEIFEDGEPREISHFARVIDGLPEGEAVPSLDTAGHTTPDTEPSPQPSTALDRSIILVFDASIQRPYLKRAVKAARKFVAERADDRIWWSVVVLADRPYSLQPLTHDGYQVVETPSSVLEQNAAGAMLRVPTPAVPRRAP